MKTTGYQIREAIRRWQLRRDAAEGQYSDSLHKFEGEEKERPLAASSELLKTEAAIAQLQVAQTRYNLAVQIRTTEFGEIPLVEGVKRIGGIGRLEKLWRKTATDRGSDRYGYHDRLTRLKDQETAVRTISMPDAAKEATRLGRVCSELREAIAVGNAKEVEIENLDAALFE